MLITRGLADTTLITRGYSGGFFAKLRREVIRLKFALMQVLMFKSKIKVDISTGGKIWR